MGLLVQLHPVGGLISIIVNAAPLWVFFMIFCQGGVIFLPPPSPTPKETAHHMYRSVHAYILNVV